MQRALPTLHAALDERAVRDALDAALLGRGSSLAIATCTSVWARLRDDGACDVRYEADVVDRISGASWRRSLVGRVLPTREAARSYVGAALTPLASRAAGREELEPFVTAACALDELRLAVAAWPLDAGLPTLVEATDPALMEGHVAAALGRRPPGAAHAKDRVLVGRRAYVPGSHCTLRYTLADRGDGDDLRGELASDRRGERAGDAVRALGARRGPPGSPSSSFVPPAVTYLPALGVTLVVAPPGETILDLLRGSRAGGPGDPWGVSIGGAVEAAARLLTALHAEAVRSLPRRRAGDALADAVAAVGWLRRVDPGAGRTLGDWLDDAERLLAGTRPGRPRLCHGDFTLRSPVFDGSHCGLVELGPFVNAEPAEDVGGFVAHLRLAARNPVDELGRRFVDAYVAAAEGHVGDPGSFEERVRAYEILALVRVAVEAWRTLRPGRAARALTALEAAAR